MTSSFMRKSITDASLEPGSAFFALKSFQHFPCLSLCSWLLILFKRKVLHPVLKGPGVSSHSLQISQSMMLLSTSYFSQSLPTFHKFWKVLLRFKSSYAFELSSFAWFSSFIFFCVRIFNAGNEFSHSKFSTLRIGKIDFPLLLKMHQQACYCS